MACFGFGKSKAKEPIIPFTNFVLKVDATGAWESTVAKVLKKTKCEVSNFRMDNDGTLQMSGTLNPVLLLKVLAKSGKSVQLVDWKFGACSRNLHMPDVEQFQQYKRYNQYLAELQALYDDTYHKHRGGHGNAQYLPSGHPFPQTHYLPAYDYPRY